MGLIGWTPATFTFRWLTGFRWQTGYVRLDGDVLMIRGGLLGFWGPHRVRLDSVRRAEVGPPSAGSIELCWRFRRIGIRELGNDADEVAALLELRGIPVLRRSVTPA